MQILLQNRSTYRNSIAGDSIQILKTYEYLKKNGVKAEISSSLRMDLSEYHLVHLFNIIPIEETFEQFQNARSQNKPVILSTIFWDPQEYLSETGQNDRFGVWWHKTNSQRQEILRNVDLILPNSQAELQLLHQCYDFTTKAQIVPNAADYLFSFGSSTCFNENYPMKGEFLLSVGRICQRKNQLRLIQVAKKLRIPLVIIGPVNDHSYYLECRREAVGQKIRFINTLTPPELASAYAAARVHALVSWYDTPGLVSLEAALSGCNIVTTDRGCTREYFGEWAYYCEPGDLQSIIQAIEQAWENKANPELKKHILQNYTWEKAANATYEAYQSILN